MERWKVDMGLPAESKWLDVGKKVSELALRLMDLNHISICDLTNYLRNCNNKYISADYVKEYLSGKTSLGCFTYNSLSFLGANEDFLKEIFPLSNESELKQNSLDLFTYLGNSYNVESWQTVLPTNDPLELRQIIAGNLQDLRSKFRKSSISNLFLSGEQLDAKILGRVSSREANLWEKAYSFGNLSSFDKNSMHFLMNLIARHELSLPDMTRASYCSEAQKYEFHQRWKMEGGFGGPFLPGEIKLAKQRHSIRVDPTGPTEFEKDQFRINSYVLLLDSLFEYLPVFTGDNSRELLHASGTTLLPD